MEVFTHMREYKENADVYFVTKCCERYVQGNPYGNPPYCRSWYVSDLDGNNLTLAAAQYNNLELLKYFEKDLGFPIDENWTTDMSSLGGKNDRLDYSVLMHAIANNNEKMVDYLLDTSRRLNRKPLANPARNNPKEKDALDIMTELIKTGEKINEKIVARVTEVWKKSEKVRFYVVNDGNIEHKKDFLKRFFANGKPDIKTLEEIQKYLGNIGNKSNRT
jgi:ankyrin repeat protein